MIAVIITVIAVLAPILTHGLELNARLVSSSSSDGDGDSTDESISIPPDSAAAAVAAHTHTPHATTTPPSHTNTLNPVPKKSDTIDRRGFDEESSSSPDADGVELSIHHAADDDDHTSSSESTHCKGVGFCTECRSDEAGATYCSHNNAKELIECRVIATTTMTTNRTRTNLYEQSHIPNEGAERVIRTFTHFAPCENDGRYGPNSFWAFEVHTNTTHSHHDWSVAHPLLCRSITEFLFVFFCCCSFFPLSLCASSVCVVVSG